MKKKTKKYRVNIDKRWSEDIVVTANNAREAAKKVSKGEETENTRKINKYLLSLT